MDRAILSSGPRKRLPYVAVGAAARPPAHGGQFVTRNKPRERRPTRTVVLAFDQTTRVKLDLVAFQECGSPPQMFVTGGDALLVIGWASTRFPVIFHAAHPLGERPIKHFGRRFRGFAELVE